MREGHVVFTPAKDRRHFEVTAMHMLIYTLVEASAEDEALAVGMPSSDRRHRVRIWQTDT
jgi:hypothetical protein